jgi:GDP-mannose 6-dehydrogenase
MRISIFGLGYVGAVCAGCLSARGHDVVGVDVAKDKIDMINAGKSPIVEPGLGELLAQGIETGRLRGTTNFAEAIRDTDLSMICVGTPSKKNGDLELNYIEAVCREIGFVLRDKTTRHTIVVRSTVLPGTVANVVIPILEDCSGKKAGVDFGVAVNPEFLRESTAIADYDQPPMTVIGEFDKASGDVLQSLYEELDAPIIRKDIAVAEMIKYTCNVWHATKVTFANEIGNIANSLMRSNESQVQNAFDIVSSHDKRKVALLGLSFKAGTDDLRESPLVDLAEMLIGKGYDLSIYDSNVEYARVHGANKDYIESKIPHVSSLLNSDFDAVINNSDVIILGNRDEKFRALVQDVPHGKQVIDLVGFMSKATSTDGRAEGICW